METTVLLTGANGFLGSHLVPVLVRQNCRVLCPVRPQRGKSPEDRLRRAIAAACPDDNAAAVLAQVETVAGDFTQERFGLADGAYEALLARTDHIIHCAAMTTFSPNEETAQWKVNVAGTENMLRVACDRRPGDGLHYISTAYVSGDRTGTVYETELDQGQNFYNGYERSKFQAEKLVEQYRHEQGLPVTVYRPSVIVGDSESGRTVLFNGMYLFLRFLQSMRQAFSEKRDGRVVVPMRGLGNPDATKNYVHIDYVVDMVRTIFFRPETHGRTYHITHDAPARLDLLREVIEDVLGICGTSFVPQEEFERQPPDEYEQLLQEQTRMYTPYLLTEPVFDKSELGKIISADQVPVCPPMDRQAIQTLFSYAVESRWGRKKRDS